MKMQMTIALAAVLAAGAGSAWSADPEAAMKKAGCYACHANDKKVVGPSYKDVAAKYKGKADAVPHLMEKVRKGGSGVWDKVPMAPNPASKISDADLKAAVEHILSL